MILYCRASQTRLHPARLGFRFVVSVRGVLGGELVGGWGLISAAEGIPLRSLSCRGRGGLHTWVGVGIASSLGISAGWMGCGCGRRDGDESGLGGR